MPPIQAHHQQAIERLTAHFRADPDFVALIIGGSVAKGRARPDSDIDFVAVATNEAYAKRADNRQYHFYSTEFTDYECGYVDGKILDITFLRDAADYGSEPARAAFAGAFVAYSNVPEIEELVARIPVYPEAERSQKMASFYAQVEGMRWFMGEADKRDDPYLKARTASEMALFGGRLILAHNRVLYPYHKWFTSALEEAADKPERFMARFYALIERPSIESAEDFYQCLIDFTTWDKPTTDWACRFMEDSEWNWRDGRPPLADW